MSAVIVWHSLLDVRPQENRVVNVGFGHKPRSVQPARRALRVLMLPDLERAERIGKFGATRRAAPSSSC
jgi:hypothetical protein